MKDATGELSMTAVAVVAIAAIALLFQRVVWPQIQRTIKQNTYCSAAFACHCDGEDANVCTCSYIDEDGNTQENLPCPNNDIHSGLDDGKGEDKKED